MIPWYDRAFGPWYLRLYPHRNREEAERAVDAILPWLPRAGRLLDVGCGPGRHLEALAARGYDVVGLDRSLPLLRTIDASGLLGGRVVRGDMRTLPFGTGRLAGLLSMFTSFGYFGSRTAHRALLEEFARVTVPGGRFVLDYLNAPAVRSTLDPVSRREVEGYTVEERREILERGGEGRVVKKVVVSDPEGVVVERYEEEVALYERDEVETLLEGAGWHMLTTFGDYRGNPWTLSSARLLVVAERSAPE